MRPVFILWIITAVTYTRCENLDDASFKSHEKTSINGNIEHSNVINERFSPEESMTFFLHTKNNNVSRVKCYDIESLETSHYDPNIPIKLYAHGWMSNGDAASWIVTENENLWNGGELNMFMVDWEEGAAADYITAVRNTISAGTFVAKFIDWLVSLGADVANFHLIGHSLGGHLVGVAGRNVTSGKVSYITSLDPALPLWGEGSDRIRPSDARYVEVIHTAGNRNGIAAPVGHADFYPNRGTVQPGCSALDTLCSHLRAIDLWMDSIDHGRFVAQQCTDYREMYEGACANLSTTHMGGWARKDVRGIFYLETNAESPYYKD